jgi:hypothetical protein
MRVIEDGSDMYNGSSSGGDSGSCKMNDWYFSHC